MDYSLALREKNPLLFRQEYLGNFVAQCAVRDNKSNHCPEVPVHYIERNGERVGLCERCFQSYQNGAFDKDRAKRVAVEYRLYIGQQPQPNIKTIVRAATRYTPACNSLKIVGRALRKEYYESASVC